jgi:hypothetical protein
MLVFYSFMAIPFINIFLVAGILGFVMAVPTYCIDLLIHRWASRNGNDRFSRRYRVLLGATRRLRYIYDALHRSPGSRQNTNISMDSDVYTDAYNALFDADAMLLNSKIGDLRDMLTKGTADHDDHAATITEFISVIEDVACASNAHDQEVGRIALICGLLFATFVGTFFLVDTELIISRSKGLVKAGESQWTFGQTLAVILILVALADSIKTVRKSLQLSYKETRKEREMKAKSMQEQGISFISPRGLRLLSESPEIRLVDSGLSWVASPSQSAGS